MNSPKTTLHPQTEAIPQPLEIHPSVSPKAAELLLKVCEILRVTPESYDQQLGAWRCGAPCCIIGHMERLVGKQGWDSIGLTQSQGWLIFLFSYWPIEHQAPAMFAGDVKAPQAIARIETFLRTGE